MEPTLIGINIGTSKIVAAKVCAGQEVCFVEVSIGSQDPDAWVAAFATAIQRLPPHEDAAIISICGTSGSFLLTRDDGTAIGAPVMYNESYPEVLPLLRTLIEDTTAAQYLGLLTADSAFVKLFRLWRTLDASERCQVRWVVPQSVWLTYALWKGLEKKWDAVAVDPGNSRKLGGNTFTLEWPESLYAEVGIPTNLLPRIVSSGLVLGRASSDLATSLGLMGSLVLHGTTDAPADAMALVGEDIGSIAVVAGSTTSIRGVLSNVPTIDGDAYVSSHPLNPKKALWAAWATVGENLRLLAQAHELTMEELMTGACSLADTKDIPVYSLRREPLQLNWNKENAFPTARGIMETASYWEAFQVRQFEQLAGVNEAKPVQMVGGTTRNLEWLKWRASAYERTLNIYSPGAALGALLPGLLRNKIIESADEFLRKVMIPQRKIYPERLPYPMEQRKMAVWNSLSKK